MATANSRERTSEIQPSEGGIVYTVDQFLHDVQALPTLSAELRKEVLDGESYETLVRRTTALQSLVTQSELQAVIDGWGPVFRPDLWPQAAG